MSFPELAEITELRDRWVAVAHRGTAAPATPVFAALRSGLVVVDYDDDLDALCARIDEAQQTSLTIVYAASDAA